MRIYEVTRNLPEPNLTPIAKSALQTVAGQHVKDLAKSALQTVVVSKLPQILESTALKSIPGIGIIVGLYYAGQSIAKGDWVDSLMNLVSGFTSVAGSIGIAAAQASRNLYYDCYGVQVEQDLAQDPTGCKRRLDALTTTVTEELKKWINAALQAYKQQHPVRTTVTRNPQLTQNYLASRQ
jgi:hypothetical protein